MSFIIQNFSCAQIHGLYIIGINSAPPKYFVHARQCVGFLTGKFRSGAGHAFHAFVKNSGMRNGGDLMTAYQNGDTDAMIYTHYIHPGSNPSYFFTMEGVEELLLGLPGQVDAMNQKFRELYDAYRSSSSSTFNLDTNGSVDDVEDFDDDLGVVPCSSAWKHQFQSFTKYADLAIEAVRESALEKGKVEIERLKGELALEKMKNSLYAKDAEVQKEKEELAKKNDRINSERAAFEAEKAKWENERMLQGNAKVSRNDDGRRVDNSMYSLNFDPRTMGYPGASGNFSQRFNQHGANHGIGQSSAGDPEQFNSAMAAATGKKQKRPVKTFFSEIISTCLDNSAHGVNDFIDMPDDIGNPALCDTESPFPNLIVHTANGILQQPGTRYHIIAFYHDGMRVSKHALRSLESAKEAYGVEIDGFHCLCIVLLKSYAYTFEHLAKIPYRILPRSSGIGLTSLRVSPRHVSVLTSPATTDDPVIGMLKQPCARKWKWHRNMG
jgi:hypothetical protein